MLQDFRYAWRSLSATPRLSPTAIACAALGLGAALFMTTLVNAVLFGAPAMPHAERPHLSRRGRRIDRRGSCGGADPVTPRRSRRPAGGVARALATFRLLGFLTIPF
jgi:hypothetical protein